MILEQYPTLLSLSAADMLRLADELKDHAVSPELLRQTVWISDAIDKGWASAEAGKLHTVEDAKAQLLATKTRWKAERELA